MYMKASQKKQANFFLSVGIIHQLQSHVPKGQQGQFVEEALRMALSQVKFQEALKSSFGAWKTRDKTSEQLVRNLRKSKRPLR